jgi:predicted lipoprotein with Yx(FWY)xxD motif
MLSRFIRIRISFVALGVIAAAVLLVAAACGDDDSTAAAPTTAPAQATAPASPTTAPTRASSPTSAPTTSASTAATTLKTATAGSLGTVITDASGMTLYTFDDDKTAGKSSCNAGCVGAWPTVVVTAAPTKSSDITGDLTTITRDDGATQVSYKGRPLDRFAGDTKPGDTNGQGISGTWFVAKP